MEQAVLHAVEQLAPWLVVAYALECLWRVLPGHVLLTSATGLAFRWREVGWHLASLSPLALAVRTWRPPWLVTADGIFVLQDHNARGIRRFDPAAYTFADFAALPTVTARDADLSLGDESLATCPSPVESAHWGTWIEELRARKPSAREAVLAAHLRARFDDTALRREVNAVAPALQVTRILSALFISAVALVVGMAVTGDLIPATVRQVVYAIAAVALVAAVAAAVTSAAALRRAGVPPPAGALLSICLFPLGTFHAAATLGCHVGWRYDWLALARVYLPAAAFGRLARIELAGAEHALRVDGAPPWRTYWGRRRDAVAALCMRAGVSAAELAGGSMPRDPRIAAACAFCGGEYRVAVSTCQDCGAPIL